MSAKERWLTIVHIADRAIEMGISNMSKLTLIMDISNADAQFNLDVVGLLNAEPFDFAHDVWGIQDNINRTTHKVGNHFVPRYARIRS